jgi:hypothetical protein
MSEPLPADPDMAEPRHLSAELFRRFLDHQVSQPERRMVVRHLVSQCPECLGLVGRIVAEGGYWFGKDAAAGLAEGDRFLASFEAASASVDRESRRIAFEHLRGLGHWSALDPLLPQERLPAVMEHKDWHHWGLFRALLDAARWYRSRDPQEAVDIAQLALDTVGLLDPKKIGGEAAAKDMRSNAFALLADCRRRASDLDGARAAIAEAWKWNEEGAGDPWTRRRSSASMPPTPRRSASSRPRSRSSRRRSPSAGRWAMPTSKARRSSRWRTRWAT